MKNKSFRLVVRIGVLVLAVSTGALAQAPKHMIFRGLISDYTPQTISGQPVGPWEMRGVWSLIVKRWDGKADFSAALAMVHSDLGVTGGDLNSSVARGAHTHHITLVDATVTPLANGFRVSGPAIVTGNGAFPAPFGPNSTLQIDITGGNTIAYSNIQLTFTGDAVKHFGSQPINGVVRRFD
jgi:hypothetical protein